MAFLLGESHSVGIYHHRSKIISSHKYQIPPLVQASV
ncbi:MAG: hypothetical protein ACI9L9_002320 [Marivirga sp.]|jgi:hypothetical protein